MLTVLDEYTKEVHVLWPERQIGSADVIRLVRAAIAEHGAPEFIRSDNGPEFVAQKLQQWLASKPSRPFTSPRPARGEMGSSKASIVASAMSASTANSSESSPKRASSSKTSAKTTTLSGRTVRTAISPRNAFSCNNLYQSQALGWTAKPVRPST